MTKDRVRFALAKVAKAETPEELEYAVKLAKAVNDLEERKDRGEPILSHEFRVETRKGEGIIITYPDGTSREFPWSTDPDDLGAIFKTYQEWLESTPDSERFMKAEGDDPA